ncbi:unnamed protein product, partial [Phaeothamnion confervicola]
ASILTVAVLHLVNLACIPINLFKSYPVYAGVQDALVQWWYGHNAVGFLLTTPFLGMMYYYLPKAANRPVYSYKLSIIHFWSLIFLYIWAGPHHLLYTALPDWSQTLGMVFSLMLIAPSWGGMLNGLLTLKGNYEAVRTDPVLKFFVVALSFYGMATFEGPMLAIKSVSALGHYTDWIVGHVHSGALGWVGFTIFATFYWLVPKLYNTTLYSVRLATAHFWIGTVGIVLYITSMWITGVTQGLMWRAFSADGTLTYNFLETVKVLLPYYVVRATGGTLYLIGTLMCCYNLYKTARQGTPAVVPVPVKTLRNLEESHGLLMTVLVILVVLIGGIVEIVPLYFVRSSVPPIEGVVPYTPLELEGRDIYIREGCYLCHSQMVRPFRDETERYGPYSKAGEFVYDRPFQFGSKRNGPDLHRVGGKYPDSWHYMHMRNPRDTSPGSIMPNYPWLHEHTLDTTYTEKK